MGFEMKNVKIALIVVVTASLLPVAALRWIDPPTSAFMLRHRVQSLWNEQLSKNIAYRWVDWKKISPFAPLAVVASEDQKFPSHWGFDTESIAEALEDREKGIRSRGASTITQQVAKNLFLWPGRNFIRKGLEAYFTVLIEMLWPKQRILEVYLNIAEFGNGVYGIRAASNIYFNKSPLRLSRGECALMAAVLPNPLRLRLNRPSAYMRNRARWILSEMDRLDRISATPYLHGLDT